MNAQSVVVAFVLDRLRHEGLLFERSGSGDEYRPGPASRSRFLHDPVVTLPADVLNAYVAVQSRSYGRPPDAVTEALDTAALHVVEALTTDHGEGLNATTAVGFRTGRGGDVEFFVEQDRPPVPPGTGDVLEWVAEPPRHQGRRG